MCGPARKFECTLRAGCEVTGCRGAARLTLKWGLWDACGNAVGTGESCVFEVWRVLEGCVA